MAYQSNYRSPFGDTTYTKVFVGGLAWETPTEELRQYFEQFGEILEAVVITDKHTGKSKGYGFVTFRDSESAARACVNPNPVIDGRRANCNIASLGRPLPSPPRGRNQGGSQGVEQGFAGMAAPLPASGSQVIYPPYGYAYTPDQYAYLQAMYSSQLQQQAQYYQQVYGASSASSSGVLGGSPYYYGYPSFQAPSPRGVPHLPHHHRFPTSAAAAATAAAPNLVYYPSSPAGHGSFSNPPFQRQALASSSHGSEAPKKIPDEADAAASENANAATDTEKEASS